MPFMLPEYEVNEGLHKIGHDYLSASYGQYFGAVWDDALWNNPATAIARMTETLDWAPKAADLYGGLYDDQEPSSESRFLSPEDWKGSHYYRQGLTFPEGVKESVAKIMAERYDERTRRADIVSRAPKGILKYPAMVGVSLAASMLDPLNLAAAFVPIVPAVQYARMVNSIGKPLARAATGAMEGAAGAAMLEPLVYGANRMEQNPDYGLTDSFLNIVYGGIIGGGLHVGLGAVGDYLAKRSHFTREAALRAAVGQMAEGRRVNVEPLFHLDGGIDIKAPYQVPRDDFVLAHVPKETQDLGFVYEMITHGKETQGVSGLAEEKLKTIQDSVAGYEAQHEKIVKSAVANNQPVPVHVLEDYAGFDWADQQINKINHESFMGGAAKDILSETYANVDEIRKIGISTDSIRADYGSEGVQQINRSLPGIIRRGGSPLDVVATDLGYVSADALYNHLVSYKSKAKTLSELSDADLFAKMFEESEYEASLYEGEHLLSEYEAQGRDSFLSYDEHGVNSEQVKTKNIDSLQAETEDVWVKVEELKQQGLLDPEREAIMMESAEQLERSNALADALESITECLSVAAPF